MKLFAWMFPFTSRALICCVAICVWPLISNAQTLMAEPVPVTAFGKPTPADEEAALAVYRALYEDPRVVSAYAMVNVTNGVATLSGSVESLKAKAIAEILASRTPGVTRVINRLAIATLALAHPDNEIYTNIRHALATDPQVNRYRVLVGVIDGRVYLAGPVDTVFARAKIANLAGSVPGVVKVENALTVPQGSNLYDPYGNTYPRTKRPSDEQVKKDINSQMEASPLVEPRQVNVDVKHGVATLTGKVSSEDERQALIHNAYAGGAKQVRDNLQVVQMHPEASALAPTGRVNE